MLYITEHVFTFTKVCFEQEVPFLSILIFFKYASAYLESEKNESLIGQVIQARLNNFNEGQVIQAGLNNFNEIG